MPAKTITIDSPANLVGLVVIVARVLEIKVPDLKRCMCRTVTKFDDNKLTIYVESRYLFNFRLSGRVRHQERSVEYGTLEMFHVINTLAISCFKVILTRDTDAQPPPIFPL